MIESTEQKVQEKSTQKRKKITTMEQVTQIYIQHFHMIDILQQTSYTIYIRFSTTVQIDQIQTVHGSNLLGLYQCYLSETIS